MSVDAEKVKKTAASLIAAAYVDSAPSADGQVAGTAQIDKLRAIALSQTPNQDPDVDLAASELESMGRAGEISSLNKAAVSLAGITALVTALFTGIGFSTGDLERMIRDHVSQGLIFLILAGVAILLGTFAFVINGSYSRLNLNLERGAVYLGIGCAAIAFCLVAWGLSQDASAATTPTIAASFDRSTTSPVLNVTVASSDVPHNDRIIATVWGMDSQGKWNRLSHLSNGAASDGTASISITVDNADSYTETEVVASVSANDSTPSAIPTASCPSGTSCVTLFKGLSTSSSSVSTSSSS